MSREKQIEEMAVTTCSLYRRYLDKKCGGNSDCDFNCHHYTRCENLYTAGYRKQSEGEWKILKMGDGEKVRTCSACHISQTVNVYKGKVMFMYCPYCGAKMKGANNEN